MITYIKIKICCFFYSRNPVYVLEIDVNDDYNEYACKYNGCRMICTTRAAMIAHIGTHIEFDWEKVYRCDHCQINFARKYELEMHFRIHSGIRVNKCSYCEKTFLRLSNMRRHVERVHKNVVGIKCFICEKVFYTTQHLNDHFGLHISMNIEHIMSTMSAMEDNV